MKREPVELEKRRPFTAAQKAAIMAKSESACAYPGCGSTDRLEFDHVIARELGGKHDASNGQALCYGCHKRKTALDQKLIAEAKRRQAKNDGTYRESRGPKLRGQGFPKGRRQIPKRHNPWGKKP